MAASKVHDYPKGCEFVAVGDGNTDVFFILSGRVQVRNYSANGREFIYSEIPAGNIFGEFSAIDGGPRSASVTATEDTVIARMPSSKFLSLLSSDFRVALEVLKVVTAKARALTERLLDLSALNMRTRLHAELTRLASAGKRDGACVTIQPAPTHHELAARVGSHREAVTKELNRLAALGYVRIGRKRIVIADVKKFERDLLPTRSA